MARLLINRNQTQTQQLYRIPGGNIIISINGYHFSDNPANNKIIDHLIENYEGFELINNVKTKSNPDGVDVTKSSNVDEEEQEEENETKPETTIKNKSIKLKKTVKKKGGKK